VGVFIDAAGAWNLAGKLDIWQGISPSSQIAASIKCRLGGRGLARIVPREWLSGLDGVARL